MEADEILDILRVPSNGREFLPEIEGDPLPRALIAEPMTETILPALRAGPAGTGIDVGVEWTFGRYAAAGRGDAVDSSERSV
ncbi:MAG: hypothetical protein JWN21_1993 [Sphingomonas bacterium]|nr:hypothetical protein [Sphingomonas bacterium]